LKDTSLKRREAERIVKEKYQLEEHLKAALASKQN
jgi:hypothetical protein